MAGEMQVRVDLSDLKLLNDYLDTTTDKVELTAKSASKDFDTLKRAIDPVYRATQTFKDQVIVAQKALVTKAITNKQYAATLQQIAANAESVGIKMNQYGQVVDVNTRKMKRFGAVGMQQVGYQVQDFAVQVQSGTSALVALGQQGSQLLGIFGPAGAIAGMILAIGTGLAGAFYAAKSASDSATEAAVSYGDAMKTAKDRAEELKLENYMLKNSIQSVAQAQLQLAILELERKKKEAAAEQEESKYGVGKRGYTKGGGIKTKGGKTLVKSYNEQIADLKAQIETLDKLFAENTALNTEAKAAEDAQAAADAAEAFAAEQAAAMNARAAKALQLYGLEGESKLIAQQKLEVTKLQNALTDKGVDLESDRAQQALFSLNIAHGQELAEYRRVAAAKAAAKAARENAKKEREDLREAIALLKEKTAEAKKLAEGIGDAFGDAFMSIVDGTKSAKDAFGDMARAIIRQLYDVLVVQQMVGQFSVNKDGTTTKSGIVGAIMTGLGFEGGGYTGSGPRAGGLDGKGGFMAMLHPNETVIDHTKGQTGGVVVNQTFNFSANGDESVKRIIASEAPKIASMTQQKLMDSRRRGGSMKQVFS